MHGQETLHCHGQGAVDAAQYGDVSQGQQVGQQTDVVIGGVRGAESRDGEEQ